MVDEVNFMYIEHLSHSGFLVENQGNYLLFDPISDFSIRKDYKSIIVFSSHSHHDHFSPKYFESYYRDEKAHFVFSKDIESNIDKSTIKNLHIMNNYEQLKIEDIKIESFGSTDMGNSYFIHFFEDTLFHSGDLNWWHWKRMNEDELKIEERDFKREISLLKDKIINYAFVPVDPRLEEHGYLAINYFIETIHPKVVIPMHSFGKYDFYKDLELHVKLGDSALINITAENQKIL